MKGLVKMSNIKILVATHKKYDFPQSEIYLPVHVGKKGKEDLKYQGDDTGDNISEKNSGYCELTGLYWGYKNLNCDYIGLVHYRRYLSSETKVDTDATNKFSDILSENEIIEYFKEYDIILPEKIRNIQKSVRLAYKRMHNIEDLDKTRDIIERLYPKYIKAFDTVMEDRFLSPCNMFIMSKENFNQYCDWLFNILFTLEREVDISLYSTYQKRIYGFLGERLLNVWCEHHTELKKKYVPIKELEPLNRIDGYKVLAKNILGIKD